MVYRQKSGSLEIQNDDSEVVQSAVRWVYPLLIEQKYHFVQSVDEDVFPENVDCHNELPLFYPILGMNFTLTTGCFIQLVLLWPELHKWTDINDFT